MSPGEVICDYKGKYTSLKVLPFEDASREVSLEGTLVSEYQGRLSGTEVGTVYWRQASDGTATLAYYGVLTTTDGELVFIKGRGMGAVTQQGQTRVRATVTFQATARQLAWLNITLASFEGEGDFSEAVGQFYA